MKKLSRDKRNQLLVVGAVTVGVLALIYFALIQPQYRSLAQINNTGKDAAKKLADIKKTIANAGNLSNELAEATVELATNETDMASGDLYSWTYDLIRHFKQPYRVDIPDVGQPVTGDMDLLPSFPYKQIRFSLTGTAYYHDLGRFIADFENTFPHDRVVHLTVEPAADNSGGEKLSFHMDIIALVKPNPS